MKNKKIEKNQLIDAIKMVLKSYTLDGNQPNLASETCREKIATDIYKCLIENENKEKYLDCIIDLMKENN